MYSWLVGSIFISLFICEHICYYEIHVLDLIYFVKLLARNSGSCQPLILGIILPETCFGGEVKNINIELYD